MQFRVDNNDISIASTAAFSSFNSKVLFDDFNAMRQVMTESFERQIIVLDGETGVTDQVSNWTRNRRGSFKTFVARGKQAVWETRQVMHSLRGKQISFYIPTFSDDLIPDTNLTSGSSTLNIQHVGYNQFVQERQPRNVIRVVFNNGDATLVRTVTSSSVISATREALTLDGTWPSTVTPADVERIEYVEKSRFDTDTITFVHTSGSSTTKVFASVKAVFE